MNIEQARFNMIEQQIRPWEVLDPNVLDLLFVVKREDFAPAAYRNLAFADMELPIGQGQVMLAPRVEARLMQELGLKKTDKVLEIGTGSRPCRTRSHRRMPPRTGRDGQDQSEQCRHRQCHG